MKSFKTFLTEANKGVEYENKVKKIIRGVIKDYPNISMVRGKGKGNLSAHDVDLILKINKVDHSFEIKKTNSEQMGGISFRFPKDKKDFIIGKKSVDIYDDETIELLKHAVDEKKTHVTYALDYFEKNDPIFKFNKIKGFPLKVSKDVWLDAIDKDIIKNINLSIKYTADFISRFYNTKNVNYIQMGGSGLFFMNNNPLNLDIPQLKGNIDIEFRLTPSGIKEDKTNKVKYSTAMLRLIGRLKFTGKSSLSLDNVDDLNKIFTLIN